MSQHAQETIRREADLIGRVAAYYRARFGRLIDRMNRQPASAASDLASIRLCVEAVDMMLASQGKIAEALGEMSGAKSPAKPAEPHVRPAA